MQSLAESNKSLGGSAGKLGDQIKDLSGKMGINLPDGATKALNGLNGFSAGTVAAMGAAAAGVAAMIKVCKELHEITLQAAADADELITKSMVTGLSTETLQQWKYAENLIDVSVETMTGSLTKLTRAMYDAQTGNAAAAETFQTLGVSITDSSGQLRSAEEVFYEVIDALGGVESQTERDAIAMEIMGRSAQDLNPLILQGSDALRELAEEAENAGYVLDESQIKKLGEVDDAAQRAKLSWTAFTHQIATEFAPASKAAMETFSKVVQQAGQVLVDTHLIENIGAIVQGVMGIVDAGTKFASAIPSWMNPISQLSTQLRGLALIAGTVADFLTIVAGLAPWNWGSGMVKQGLGMGATESNVQQLLNHNRDTTGGTRMNAYNAAGTDNWRGGLTWVGEAGPELVALPRGSRIYNNQESQQMTAAATDTSRMEALLARNVQLLEQISGEFSGLRVRRRMA
ncbi:MAG: hypothetical protein IKF98_01880 [Clostridia bacterium]|nr:hypothetical protein [Clostridia bacterium]